MTKYFLNQIKKPKIITLLLFLLVILIVWTSNSYDSLSFDSDIARDLKEISNIQNGDVVWLGPWLGPGLHASPVYYYLFYPALVLSGGQVSGMITANIILGFLSISLLGLLAVKKYGYKGIIILLVVGFLPMVTDNILHPGNGYSYIFFIIGCLSALWFDLPLSLGSFLAGMAIGFHPAAGFLPFFLLYEWWRRGRSIKSVVISAITFSIPLAPLIVFEIITKGYIMRSLWARQITGGISFGLSLLNFQTISGLLGVSQLILLVLLGLSGYFSWKSKSNKLRSWFALTVFCIIVGLLFDGLIWRYLFGIALITIFTILVSFAQRKKESLILIFFILALFLKSPIFYPAELTKRTITGVEAIADMVDQKQLVDKSKKVAVVAALTPNTEVPQADDYRFLLRNRGYEVMDTLDNDQADVLLMFIEIDPFDWQNWSNWEIQQFGSKKVDKIEAQNGVTIVVFSKGDNQE